MVSAPIERWKSPYITRLADFQSHHGPTDFAEEALVHVELLIRVLLQHTVV